MKKKYFHYSALPQQTLHVQTFTSFPTQAQSHTHIHAIFISIFALFKSVGGQIKYKKKRLQMYTYTCNLKYNVINRICTAPPFLHMKKKEISSFSFFAWCISHFAFPINHKTYRALNIHHQKIFPTIETPFPFSRCRDAVYKYTHFFSFPSVAKLSHSCSRIYFIFFCI